VSLRDAFEDDPHRPQAQEFRILRWDQDPTDENTVFAVVDC